MNKFISQKYFYAIIIIIIIILIGIISGLIFGLNFSKKSGNIWIPIPPSLITSPLVEKFYANVEGTVVEKNSNNITLEKDNQRVQILIDEGSGRTTFIRQSAQGRKEIKFEDIKIGDNLKGGISIIVKPSPADLARQRNVGEIIGHRFMVI